MSQVVSRSLIVLAFLLVLPITLVYASPEILPVNQITSGMTGIAKTVVSGTNIEEFGVEVLGVMKNKGSNGDLILVRTYGDLIERSGGIAEGMSGSPVYIDDKLVGAIAYGWSLTDHKIGMVTPIEDMLKLWDLADTKNLFPPDDNSLLKDAGFEKLATPLMVSGFNEPALHMLKEKLAPLNLVPYAVGDAPAGTSFGALEPGSAVGVELVSGDVSIGALGTVTYAEGSKVLAFGHPFLKKGNVNYLMTNAFIFTTVNGLENSFKVGTTGDTIGLINQDRGAAIAGEVGKYPSIIPMRITVHDNGIDRTVDSAVQVIQDEQLAPVLATTTVYNLIGKTMDRIGAGTVRINFQITGRDLPGNVLTRENMFYSPANIGEASVAEFYDAMNLVTSNQYHPVDILDVKVDVKVDEERRTATILEASSQQLVAKPGEKIDISVKLKPFRGEPVNKMVQFTVPQEQPAGLLTLEVRGGGMIPLTQLLLKRQGLDEDLLKPNKKKKSFEDVLKDFSQGDRNNDILVEVLDMSSELADPTLKPVAVTPVDKAKTPKATPATSTKPNDDKAKSFVTTDYIIDGEAKVLIQVNNNK